LLTLRYTGRTTHPMHKVWAEGLASCLGTLWCLFAFVRCAFQHPIAKTLCFSKRQRFLFETMGEVIVQTTCSTKHKKLLVGVCRPSTVDLTTSPLELILPAKKIDADRLFAVPSFLCMDGTKYSQLFSVCSLLELDSE